MARTSTCWRHASHSIRSSTCREPKWWRFIEWRRPGGFCSHVSVAGSSMCACLRAFHPFESLLLLCVGTAHCFDELHICCARRIRLTVLQRWILKMSWKFPRCTTSSGSETARSWAPTTTVVALSTTVIELLYPVYTLRPPTPLAPWTDVAHAQLWSRQWTMTCALSRIQLECVDICSMNRCGAA